MATVGEVIAKVSLGGMDAVDKQLRAFSKSIDRVGSDLNKLGSKLRDAGESMNEIGENIAPLSAGLVGIGGASVIATDNINSAMNSFSTKLGATGAELEKYESVMQEVAKTGVGSFEEVADAVILASKNMKGLSDAELTTATEEAIQLASVMETDVSEVTKVAGQLMKNFGTTGLESLDLIAKGYQNGMDYAGDYMDTINEYAVYFDALGFSAEDMFNVLIEGAEKGAFNLDKVGDAVKEFNIRAKDGSKSSMQAFKDLGLDAEKMTATFAKGGEDAKKAYGEVVQALAQVEDETERNAIGVALWGTQYEDMEKDVIASTGSIVDHMQNVEGASAEVAENNRTFAQDMQGYWNDIQIAIEPVGNIIRDFANDVMPKVVSGIKGMASAFSGLSPFMQKVVLAFGAFIAFLPVIVIGIGSVLTVLGTFSTVAGMVMKGASVASKGLSLLKNAFTAVRTAFTALRTLFLANPFMLIVTGIVIVAFLIYKYWDEIVAFTKSVFEGLRAWFAPYWQSIVNFVSDFVQGFRNKLQSVISFWQGLWSKIVSIAQKVWSVIKTVFLIGIGVVITLLAPIYNTFASVFNASLKIVQKVIANIRTGFSNFVGFLGKILKGIQNAFKVAWNFVYSNVIKPVINKIRAIVTTLISIVTGVLSKVRSVFSSVWNAIYGSVVSPVINRIKRIIQTIVSTASSVGGRIKSTLGGAFNSVRNTIGSAIESVKSKISSILSKGREVAGGIKSAFSNLFSGIRVPRFSLGGWKPSDLPKLPKISVQWNAKGGILDSATFIGAGEKGAEAIVPLSSQRRMKPFAQAVAKFMPDNGVGGVRQNNFNISTLVVREEADIQKIAQELNRIQQRKERARGGISYNG